MLEFFSLCVEHVSESYPQHKFRGNKNNRNDFLCLVKGSLNVVKLHIILLCRITRFYRHDIQTLKLQSNLTVQLLQNVVAVFHVWDNYIVYGH